MPNPADRKKNNALFYSTEVGGPHSRFGKPLGDTAALLEENYDPIPIKKGTNPMFKS